MPVWSDLWLDSELVLGYTQVSRTGDGGSMNGTDGMLGGEVAGCEGCF